MIEESFIRKDKPTSSCIPFKRSPFHSLLGSYVPSYHTQPLITEPTGEGRPRAQKSHTHLLFTVCRLVGALLISFCLVALMKLCYCFCGYMVSIFLVVTNEKNPYCGPGPLCTINFMIVVHSLCSQILAVLQSFLYPYTLCPYTKSV